jgi:hypothetical protein
MATTNAIREEEGCFSTLERAMRNARTVAKLLKLPEGCPKGEAEIRIRVAGILANYGAELLAALDSQE